MEGIKTGGGFLPGIFGRLQKKRSKTSSKEDSGPALEPKPSPLWKKLPKGARNGFLAMAGEFVGTFMFLFFAFAGTQIANTPASASGDTSITATGPNTSILLYIALCFGFSLAVNAWIFFRVTGGLFNPAVTLGLVLIGAVPFSRGALIVIAQMLGGMASAAVVSALFPGDLAVTTTLSPGVSNVQGVFIEMFLTAQLVFTIFMLAAEKHKSTFLAPIGIGLALFIAELAGVYYTGGSLNPARSFGPCVALRSFPSDHWVYWVGPLLGALIASGFFWFIKSCEYESVNPGQDFDDIEADAYNPDVDLTRPVVHPTTTIDGSSIRQSSGAGVDDYSRKSNSAGRGDYHRKSNSAGAEDYRMDELTSGRKPTEKSGRERDSQGTSKTYTIQSPNDQANQDGRYAQTNGGVSQNRQFTYDGRPANEQRSAYDDQSAQNGQFAYNDRSAQNGQYAYDARSAQIGQQPLGGRTVHDRATYDGRSAPERGAAHSHRRYSNTNGRLSADGYRRSEDRPRY